MASFSCNGCTELIPPQKVRLHCQTCPDYNSCANCQILGQVTGYHSMQHPMSLFRNSGVNGSAPAPASGPVASIRSPNSWTQLYNPDYTPTQIFVTTIQQIFGRLDSGRTGYVSPEAYSSFQDAQGYPKQQNIWSHALAASFGNHSAADTTLKQAYDLCSLEHILQPRNPSQQQPHSSGLRSSFASLLSGTNVMPSGPMPLLTMRGFIDAVAQDVIANPSLGWTYLNRAMRFYQIPIWREKGDVPREMIPATTPPAVQARVQMIQQNAVMNANNQLALARQTAEIQRRGNEIAVSAIGNGEWLYRP